MHTNIERSSLGRFLLAILLAISLLGIQATKPAHAATLIVTNVNDSGPGSLRQAIWSAVSGDTITFDPTLAGKTILLTSQLSINNKNLTIDGSGLNPPLVLSGNHATRILQLSFAPNVTISGLTLTHGVSNGDGGAIYVFQNSQLTLENSTLAQNQASGFGGAISVTDNGAITIVNSMLYQNQAGGPGGALSATGNATGTIANSTFSSNNADLDGGAIYGLNITLTDSTLSGNIAGEDGGALYTANLVMRNTTIDGNQANRDGGAMIIGGNGLGSIANSTVFQNQAGGDGGAVIAKGNAVVEISNSTLASNSAANGKEVFLMGLSSLDLRNTVFVCTTDINTDPCYTQLFASALSTDHSILGVGSLYDYGLAEPADNGGPTQTMALLPGSQLIDAGNDAYCPATDQRGIARPQGAHCDIGAYEYQPVRYVKWNASGANNGTSWTDAYTDLQSALAAASSGDEIWVAAGTYKPTTGTDRTISFALKNGVAIYGGFAGIETLRTQRDLAVNVTILSGDIGIASSSSDNTYHVIKSDGADSSTVLDGFTIIAGNANGSAPDDQGGGMYNNASSPILRNLIFSNNSAAGGGGMYNSSSHPNLQDITFNSNTSTAYSNGGGGLLNIDSKPSLTNVLFTNNSAFCNGGGMQNISSNPNLENVTFSHNTATAGGGMSNGNSAPILMKVTFIDNSAIDRGGYFGCGTGIGGGMSNNSDSSPILTEVTFSNNSADMGGGMSNLSGNPSLKSVTFTGNSAVHGGGVYSVGSPTFTNTTFSNNKATGPGGGIYNNGDSILTNVTFVDNSASQGGGIMNTGGKPSLVDAIFSGNSAKQGGGIDNQSSLSMRKVTLSDNSATYDGGGMHNWGNADLIDVTFHANSANQGGGIYNFDAKTNLQNVTINGNQASTLGGGIYNYYCVYCAQPVITNSIIYGNMGGEIYDVSGTALVTYSVVKGGYPGASNLDADPLLGPLQDNGGFTPTMALLPASPAVNAGDDTSCPETDQRGVTRPQGSHCDIGAYEVQSANVDVKIGGELQGNYSISPVESTRQSYQVDGGPVFVQNTNYQPILASERFIFSYKNSKSYAEMMGYPGDQLATEYWFPWYNNLSYSTQLRVSNMGDNSAEVKVYAGTTLIDTVTLASGEGMRKSYTGLDKGPLRVVSTDGATPILASERFIQTYLNSASYAEMMGYPGDQLATEYWFPWYNNISYSTQLRVSNLGNNDAEIKIYAGNSTEPIDSFTLLAGEGARKSYKIDNGPLHVVSTDGVTPILASERFIQTFGTSASYAEMMGYPGDQLTTEYCFPWYNNTSDGGLILSSQLRVSNMTNEDTTEPIKVYLAGKEIDSFNLKAGEGKRVSYAGWNSGPLCIVSTTTILTSERFISTYLNSASYSEIIGYPASRLSFSYWFPWYNNISYSTELQIAKP